MIKFFTIGTQEYINDYTNSSDKLIISQKLPDDRYILDIIRC